MLCVRKGPSLLHNQLHNGVLEPRKALCVRKGPSRLHNRVLEPRKGPSRLHNQLLNRMLEPRKTLSIRKGLHPQTKSILEGLEWNEVPETIMSALPADQIARKGLVSLRNSFLVQKMKHVLLRSTQKKAAGVTLCMLAAGGEADSDGICAQI